MPYLLAVGLALAFVAGLAFLKIGGPVISIVSFCDQHSRYNAPAWFPFVKWGTAPVRFLDAGTSLYEELADVVDESR